MPQFQAFISDLDGTLVDSEPQHAEAWLAVLANYGLKYDHDWFAQYIGTSDRFLAQDVINAHTLSKTVRELQLEKQERYHDLMRRTGECFPGVLEGLEQIAKIYPMAIATNSGRKDAEVVFDATGLRPFANISVTADDVKQLKPSPEMFIKAAGLLGIPPGACIVCEDSVAGSTGAKAAGCYVIGITSSQPAEKLSMADEIVNDSAAALARVLLLLNQQ